MNTIIIENNRGRFKADRAETSDFKPKQFD
jgi:hypothetical protein